VCKGLTPISDEEAARQYRLLHEVESVPRRFNAAVYAFYSRLVSLYLEIDRLPEDELNDSPWACNMEVSIQIDRPGRFLWPDKTGQTKQSNFLAGTSGGALLPPADLCASYVTQATDMLG
jgi:hypothetical protein